MISPYVRRLRLGSELRELRAAAGLTHEQIAKRIGQSRAQISRLENGHVVDQADVIKILDVLGVEGDRWTQVVTIAREAGEKGWWESTRGMGDRQALYANLEAGASQIREYQQTFIPGLLQTPDFVRARATAGNGKPPVALRVLPVDARLDHFTVPRCTFSIYTYPDPGDPAVVAIDTVTSDLILTEAADVQPSEQLSQRLRDASLPPDESLDLLTKIAADLPDD